MLRDNGTWESIAGKDPRKMIPEGHLHFILHGRRMKGEWITIRLKPSGKEKGEIWLLRKVADEHAGAAPTISWRPNLKGIDSGLTMAEIAGKMAQKKPMRKSAAAEPPAGAAPPRDDG